MADGAPETGGGAVDLNASGPCYRQCELSGAAAGVPGLRRAGVLLITSKPRYPRQRPLDLLVTGEHIFWGLEWIGKS